MMDCDIKPDNFDVCAMQKSDAFENIIGLTVIAAFLAAAICAAALGLSEPLFFIVIPIAFASFVGLVVKKICKRLAG